MAPSIDLETGMAALLVTSILVLVFTWEVAHGKEHFSNYIRRLLQTERRRHRRRRNSAANAYAQEEKFRREAGHVVVTCVSGCLVAAASFCYLGNAVDITSALTLASALKLVGVALAIFWVFSIDCQGGGLSPLSFLLVGLASLCRYVATFSFSGYRPDHWSADSVGLGLHLATAIVALGTVLALPTCRFHPGFISTLLVAAPLLVTVGSMAAELKYAINGDDVTDALWLSSHLLESLVFVPQVLTQLSARLFRGVGIAAPEVLGGQEGSLALPRALFLPFAADALMALAFWFDAAGDLTAEGEPKSDLVPLCQWLNLLQVTLCMFTALPQPTCPLLPPLKATCCQIDRNDASTPKKPPTRVDRHVTAAAEVSEGVFLSECGRSHGGRMNIVVTVRQSEITRGPSIRIDFLEPVVA